MCVEAARGTTHREVKLWTKLKPAYSRNAEKKIFLCCLHNWNVSPLVSRSILLSCLFNCAKMENLVSFRYLKVQQTYDREALQFIREQAAY